MPKPDLLIIAYGIGGHRAQAIRFLREAKESGEPMPQRLLSITDTQGIGLPDSAEISLRPLRDKHSTGLRSLIFAVRALAVNLGSLGLILAELRRCGTVVLVSLGPSFVFIPALAVRLAGGIVIHIETWSRFSSRSTTGRIMYRVAHHFLVQTPRLLSFYPKARFVGRL